MINYYKFFLLLAMSDLYFSNFENLKDAPNETLKSHPQDLMFVNFSNCLQLSYKDFFP